MGLVNMNICSKVTDTQKNYSTIIIITIYPLSERDYNRFGIDTFLKHGYLVKILDLCLLFTQKYADIVIPNLKEYEAYKQIPNINELSSELCNYSSNNCLIIIYCNILYKSLKIYKEIKKYSFDYAIVNLGNLPKPKYRESKKIPFDSAKIKRCIKLLSVRAICDKLLTFLPNKYYWVLGISPAKYLMIGGANALKVIPGQYISDKTTIINAHSMDYDRYLEMYTSSSSDKIVISKYCVFIDEYFPYHPDYTVNGEQSPCSEERYYPALNSFFDYIEKKV